MTDLQKTTEQIPAYLQGQDDGREELASYSQLSFIKTVQDMSDPELKEEFSAGCAVLMPDRALIAEHEVEWSAVCVYFWPSYQKWRDVNDQSADGGPIVEQSIDPKSEAARKCAIRGYSEPYPDGNMAYRYDTSLNFLLFVESLGQLAVLPFIRGGAQSGNSLRSFLQRRGGPIWSQRITFSVGTRMNRRRQQWYQIEHSAAAFVKEEECEPFRKMYENAKQSHSQLLLGTAEGGDDG